MKARIRNLWRGKKIAAICLLEQMDEVEKEEMNLPRTEEICQEEEAAHK